jgi:putative membrane protein insertion efficiency factor
VRKLLVFLITFYQKGISPLHGPCCRFVPTCSEYAIVALERFGVAKGLYLAFRRLLRCQPFHAGGYDPVPEIFSLRYGKTLAGGNKE